MELNKKRIIINVYLDKNESILRWTKSGIVQKCMYRDKLCNGDCSCLELIYPGFSIKNGLAVNCNASGKMLFMHEENSRYVLNFIQEE